MTTHTDVYPTNNQAIASFILGILSLMIPFIGIILGAIGIICYFIARKQIEQSDQMNRGLSIAGLTFSMIGFVINLFAIIGFLAFIFFIVVASA